MNESAEAGDSWEKRCTPLALESFISDGTSVPRGPSSIPRRETSLSGLLGSNSLSSPTAEEKMPQGEGMESDGRTDPEDVLSIVAPENEITAKEIPTETPQTSSELIRSPEPTAQETITTPHKSGSKRSRMYKQVRVTRKVIGSLGEGKRAAGIGIAIGMTSKGEIFLTGMAPKGPAEMSKELIKGDQLLAIDGVEVNGKAMKTVVDMIIGDEVHTGGCELAILCSQQMILVMSSLSLCGGQPRVGPGAAVVKALLLQEQASGLTKLQHDPMIPPHDKQGAMQSESSLHLDFSFALRCICINPSVYRIAVLDNIFTGLHGREGLRQAEPDAADPRISEAKTSPTEGRQSQGEFPSPLKLLVQSKGPAV
eukprot:746948-Hanusia_phi.AAC.5